jgi:hypothetical protein
MAVALANSLAQPGYGAQSGLAPKPGTTAQCGAAGPSHSHE